MRSRSVPEAKTLYINLVPLSRDYVELRYSWDKPYPYEPRSLPLSQIANLLQQAETDYYTSRPVEFTTTGQQLYNWLDGSDRWLSRAISQRRDKVVLAIATSENLAHLPWEVLHDSKGFLVERLSPAVVPVRWLPDVETTDIAPENRPLQVLFMACSPLNTSPVLDFEREEARILTATARQQLVLTVEESGFLQELGNLVKSYDKSYFDILQIYQARTFLEEVGHSDTESVKPSSPAISRNALRNIPKAPL